MSQYSLAFVLKNLSLIDNDYSMKHRVYIQPKSKGFTLLELLIAISLTTILMTVLVVGMNLISRDWQKSNNRLEQKLDESLLLLQLEKAILGTYPYQFKTTDLAKEKVFFNGSESELSWISTVSPNRSAGLMLWRIKSAEDGGLNLSVLPAYPGDLNAQLSKYDGQHSTHTTYFKDYKISFSYLSGGAKKGALKSKKWTQSWIMKDNKLPLGIRMKLTNELDHYEMFAFVRVSKTQKLSSFDGN